MSSAGSTRQTRRVRVPTEKKRLYELDKANQKLDILVRKIYQKISTIDTMLQADGDSKEINDEEAELQKLFAEFSELNISSKPLIQDNQEEASVEKKADKVKQSFHEHQQRYHSYLQDANPSVKSSKRASHKGSRSAKESSSSKRSSKLLEQKVRLAELQLEQQYLEEKEKQEQELHLQEQQLQQKQKQLQDEELKIKQIQEHREKLKLKFEVEKAKTAIKILQEDGYSSVNDDLKDIPRFDYTASYLANLDHAKGESVHEDVKQKVVQVSHSTESEMLTLMRRTKAPTVELDMFSGSSIDYPYFMATFAQVVEENIPDQRGRLSILVKYTKGDVKELVKSCVYLADDVCYTRAKELLDRKFGSPFKIAADYRKQLMAWPKVKASDAASLNQFEIFLLKYQSSMARVGRASDNMPELLQLLQSKLPIYLQDRWNRTAYKVRSKFNREPGIEDFVKLISKETVLLDDPLYSREAISDLSRNHHDKSNKQVQFYQVQ